MTHYVIITADKVYGTYEKTICAMESFSNEEEKELAEQYKDLAVVFEVRKSLN